MKRTTLPRIASFGIVVVLLGCPPRYEAWLEEDARAGAPTFGVGPSRGSKSGIDVSTVALTSCAEHNRAMGGPGSLADERLSRLLWAVVRVRDGGPIQRVRYGELPPGYRQLSGTPRTLAPGCYVAEFYGALAGEAYVPFEVTVDGGARELRWGGPEVARHLMSSPLADPPSGEDST